MTTRALILASAAGIALLAGSLSVQADQRGPGKMGPRFDFSEVDTDGDGKLTAEELKAHAAARFAEADTDGDGFLSAEELVERSKARAAERAERRAARMAERMLERADDNDDGKLSLEEMQPTDRTQSRMFDRLDSDDDGVISEEEFAQMKERGKNRREGRGQGGRHGGGDHGKDGGRWMKHGDR